MADDRTAREELGSDRDDLVAPRRIFKRKRRPGLVLALKIGLPAVAIVCVAYIVIWSRTHQSTINPIAVTENVNKQGSDVTVQKVKYDGVDAQNRPFTITADSAVQPQSPPPPVADASLGGNGGTQANGAPPQRPEASAQSNIINLVKPLADMTLKDGSWVAVQADNGVYDRDAGTVDLSGNVTLFHDTGLTFETDAARVDLKNDVASGNQPVEGSRPDGELAAEGFEVRDNGNTVLFTGRSYMKLYPKSKTAGGNGS